MLSSKLAKFAEEEKLSRLLFGKGSDILDKASSSENESDDEQPRKKKPKEEVAAWRDSDDEESVDAALGAQGRRLPGRRTGEADQTDSRPDTYAALLQDKYRRVVGTPAWADLNTSVDENSDDEIIQSVGHIKKSSNLSLKKGQLEFKRLKHLNTNTGKEGSQIDVIQFHPMSTVALVAGNAGIASLLTVDGKNNDKLHCISFKNFPIHCGRFTPDGSSAVLGSRFPYYYIYDMMNANAIRVSLPKGITKMAKFEFSSCGKYLVVGGRFGEIHLFCAKSRELIQTLKLGGEVVTLAFSHDNTKLFAHSSEGNITVWNLSTLRVIHKWTDDGCLSGSSLAVSPCGKYIATGSEQGVVNLYETKDTLSSKHPQPKKVFLNLRTSISGLKFNSSSEILAFYSTHAPNAIRLAHLPSFEVFSNFPSPQSDYGHCTTVNFSPNSGFMSVGSNKKIAYLYRLKHYKTY